MLSRIYIIFLTIASNSFNLVLTYPGDISKAKCEEYAKYVYTEEDSPVMLRKSSKSKVSQCGIVEVPLVIGGVEAKSKEFPHMALIGYSDSSSSEISWKCGGTLISENYVLSAAHCISNQGGSPRKVRLGEVNLETEDESKTQDRNIAEIIKHPNYSATKKYHDIALLRLDSPVTFDAYVRPACLHTAKTVRQNKAIAAGFGKTSFDASEGSKKLMKVTLNIIPNKDCEQYFKREINDAGLMSRGITEEMLCSGELRGGKDTCQGDSGGPLQEVLTEPYCMYEIIGVVSFGKFCGFANQPAIYTNVANYIQWIESTVWK